MAKSEPAQACCLLLVKGLANLICIEARFMLDLYILLVVCLDVYVCVASRNMYVSACMCSCVCKCVCNGYLHSGIVPIVPDHSVFIHYLKTATIYFMPYSAIVQSRKTVENKHNKPLVMSQGIRSLSTKVRG